MASGSGGEHSPRARSGRSQVAARELVRVPARDARAVLLSDCVHNTVTGGSGRIRAYTDVAPAQSAIFTY